MRALLYGRLALVGATLIWSTSFSLTKIILQDIGPISLAAVRTLLTAIFLVLIILSRRQHQAFISVFRRSARWAIGGGLCGLVLLPILENTGIRWVPSGIAAVLGNTIPVFTVILATVIISEPLTRRKIFGIILSFSGISLLAISGEQLNQLWQSRSFIGSILLVIGALGWSIYDVINKKLLGHAAPLIVTTVGNVVAAPALIVTSLVFEQPLSALTTLPISQWIILLYLTAGASILAYLLWLNGLNTMPASHSTFYLFLVPVFALILGYIILQERLNWLDVCAIALVFSGIIIMEYRKQNQNPNAKV